MKPIKAYTNLLQSQANMLLKRSMIGNYPAYAVIEPASYCQLRCPACPTGLRLGTRASASMSWERYKSVIDEVGDYLFRLDLYNWGEPLLHEQTPEFIQYAESKGIRVSVDSNLSVKLSDDYVRRVVKSGLERLVVSLDGATQETYSIYRRGGDISLVRENMLRIRAAKNELGLSTPTVRWKYLVFQHNEHEVDLAQKAFRDWGADEFTAVGAIMPKVSPYDQLFKPSAQYTSCLDLYSWGKRGGDRTCSWLYQGLVLNANGTISPCDGIEIEDDDFARHSVDQGFFATWNNRQFVEARRFCANPSKKNRSGEAATEKLSTCERCPAFRLECVTRLPEGIINEAIRDEARRLLAEKKDARLPLYFILVGLAGGKPVRKYLIHGMVSRLKKKVTWRGRDRGKLGVSTRRA